MKHTSLPSASRAEIAPVSSGNQAIIPAPPVALEERLGINTTKVSIIEQK